jgi:uncharacterized RDD family membrane protein YckC
MSKDHIQDINSIYVPKQQKLVKRFAAWVIDIILVVVVATGIGLLTSLIYGYDRYNNVVYEKCIQYGVYVENTEGSISYDGKSYILCSDDPSISAEEVTNRETLCSQDKEYQKAMHKRNVGQIIITTTGISVSLLIFEFIVPLFLKHGRTIGMKFFDVAYVTEEDIDVSFKNVFVRFLFGKLIIEGIVPYLGFTLIILNTGYGIVGIVMILVPIYNLIIMLMSPHKRGIHDVIARVKPIDNSCQIYFKTTEELAKNKAQFEQSREKVKKY